MRYEKEQKQKQLDWEAKMRAEGKDVAALKKQYMNSSCSHTRMRMMAEERESAEHDHSHDHDHEHDHHHHHDHSESHDHQHHEDHAHDHSEDHSRSSSHITQSENDSTLISDVHPSSESKSAEHSSVPLMRPTCGFMTPEQMAEMERERRENPPMPIREKNRRKIEAVYATREDGNRLFKEGEYESAFKIYERGVLIINGMFGASEEEDLQMEQMEALLDLNMAYCKLKMDDPTECINLCKMSLAIDKANAKAYYRMAEAFVAMGDYSKARRQIKHAISKAKFEEDLKKRKQFNKAIKVLSKRIDVLSKEQREKDQQRKMEMSRMMQQSKKKKDAKGADSDQVISMREQPYSEEEDFDVSDGDDEYEEEEEAAVGSEE